MAHIVSTTLRRLRQEAYYEFKASLCYIVNPKASLNHIDCVKHQKGYILEFRK